VNTLKGKKVLVFGGGGRLGKDLVPLLKAAGANVIAPTSEEIDIATTKIWQCVMWHGPDIVVNLAAYTDVPKAETLEGKDKCVRTNIIGNKFVCESAHYHGAKVVYISSDYVYPGTTGDYTTEDVSPLGCYGITKYVGEWFCNPDTDLVIRTSMKARGTWGKNAYTKVLDPVWTNADWVDIIAEKIVEVIADERTGTINLGTEKKLLSDLARAEYPEVELMKPTDLDVPYKYPTDCSMVLDE
jgi:dTDP-4-dehydrorhamnose reductase